MPIKRIKHLVDGGVKLLGFDASRKRQEYRCRYEARVKNISPEKVGFSLVMPYPVNDGGQKLISNPEFRPSDASLLKEEDFGNRYVSWTAELESGHSITFSQFFECVIEPRAIEIDPNLSIDDYEKSSDKVVTYLNKNSYLEQGSGEGQKLALDLAAGEKNIKILMDKFNKFVIDRLSYGNPFEGLYSMKDALEKSEVDGGGFDSLLAGLCRTVGIPARIVSGFWTNSPDDVMAMHAWVEILLPTGDWVPADPSVEKLRKQKRSRRSGELGFVGSDRVIFSYGSDMEIKAEMGAREVDILQNPILIPKPEDKQLVVERGFYAVPLKKIKLK